MPASPFINPSEIYYKGTLVYESRTELSEIFNTLVEDGFDPQYSMDGNRLEDIEPEHIIFIGHRKVPAAIYASPSKLIDIDNDYLPEAINLNEKDKEITVTLKTDCIPFTSDVFSIESVLLKELSEKLHEELPVSFMKKVKRFSQKCWIHGYDIEIGPFKCPAITQGSCFIFKADLKEKHIRKLWLLSLLGMGGEKKDGYGRFEVNWQLHKIRNGQGGEII